MSSSAQISAANLNDVLAAAMRGVRRAWSGSVVDFTNGECHSLAVALYRAMGEQGALKAGFDCTGQGRKRAPTEYIHMVYEAPNGTVWDIGGRNADGRWEEAFGHYDMQWITVPHHEVAHWLARHNATFNPGLTDQLTAALRPLLP